MHTDAQQRTRAEAGAGGAGVVVLAQVDAVGAGRPGDLQAVVDHEGDAAVAAQRREPAGQRRQRRVVQLGGAELDHVRPARDRRPRDLLVVPPGAQPRRGHDAQSQERPAGPHHRIVPTAAVRTPGGPLGGHLDAAVHVAVQVQV